jgi:hypothetical protein
MIHNYNNEAIELYLRFVEAMMTLYRHKIVTKDEVYHQVMGFKDVYQI